MTLLSIVLKGQEGGPYPQAPHDPPDFCIQCRGEYFTFRDIRAVLVIDSKLIIEPNISAYMEVSNKHVY